MATKKKTKKAPAKLYVDPESDFAKSAAATTTPPAELPVVAPEAPLSPEFPDDVMKTLKSGEFPRPGNTPHPGFGFNPGPIDSRLNKVVSQMLFGPIDPKKTVKKVETVVEYEDGSKQTIFMVGGAGPRIQLSMHRRLTREIADFTRMEEHLWPDFINVEEAHNLTVYRHLRVVPTVEWAAHLKKFNFGKKSPGIL